MAKNYYEILGVPGTASLAQIKAAFRRRAKRLHPDHSRRGSGPFLELKEAHDVLVDPSRRAAYDREAARQQRRNFGSKSVPEPFPGPSRRRRPFAEPFRARPGLARPSQAEDLFQRLWGALDEF